ncbi:3'-5' exoribonuclease YhaM family protein [Planctomicrobium piriforme]|uniref:3'-5' exoribonuclease n=1 Tax=Planctomicrobium piriforme TaxID=1576369 RepID=A0A1I3RJR3_9PLAN|nr:HD domain-containing protein [Planctomicrobium piriforme]SFJ45979.1 3'-5' exoribonuclease [Planctomicrobium piriforme]
MTRRFVNLLQDGETLEEVYLLADRQLRANRNGDTYLLTQLRDRTGQVSGLLWNVGDQQVSHLRPGDYVKVRGKVQLFQGNLQIIMTRIDAAGADNLSADDFIPQTSGDTERQLGRLKEILLSIKDPDLRALMGAFFDDPEIVDGLRQAPAGVRLHHAYHGGLLEHVLTLAEGAVRLSDLYPKVDYDLVLAGVFLHDLGKIRELGYDTTFIYTDEGQLIGHLVMGVEMLSDKIRVTEQVTGRPFPSEKAMRLKHLILSHHGSYEFGSPKLPMTPEAIALHHLDNLDAKTNEFLSLIESDPNAGSSWTPYHASMQRKLFKGSGSDWST